MSQRDDRGSGDLLSPRGAELPDVLERILDKGLVIAGDISINLVDVELLTIKVRLLLASMDKATEMGIDWWRHDPFLVGSKAQESRSEVGLAQRVARLEQLLEDPAMSTRRSLRRSESLEDE